MDIAERLAGTTKRCPCLYCSKHPGTPRHKPVYFFPDSSGVRVPSASLFAERSSKEDLMGWTASKDLAVWVDVLKLLPLVLAYECMVHWRDALLAGKEGAALTFSRYLLAAVQAAGAEVPE